MPFWIIGAVVLSVTCIFHAIKRNLEVTIMNYYELVSLRLLLEPACVSDGQYLATLTHLHSQSSSLMKALLDPAPPQPVHPPATPPDTSGTVGLEWLSGFLSVAPSVPSDVMASFACCVIVAEGIAILNMQRSIRADARADAARRAQAQGLLNQIPQDTILIRMYHPRAQAPEGDLQAAAERAVAEANILEERRDAEGHVPGVPQDAA